MESDCNDAVGFAEICSQGKGSQRNIATRWASKEAKETNKAEKPI